MKKANLLLFAASLLPASVLAWNTSGEDSSIGYLLSGSTLEADNKWGGNERLVPVKKQQEKLSPILVYLL